MLAWMTAIVIAAHLAPLVGKGDDRRANEVVYGPGECTADGFLISAPYLCLRCDRPGVVYGLVQFPGQDREYAYLLVIKGDEPRRLPPSLKSECEFSGLDKSTGRSEGFVAIRGLRVTVEYEAVIDRTGRQPPRERLVVNGAPVDVTKGRVILADLSGDKVRWEQVRGTLPGKPAVPRKSKDITAAAKEALAGLRKERPEVRAFLK